MSIPELTLKVYEMTRVDHAIFNFSKLANPTLSDLNFVKCQASAEEGIDLYRSGAAEMNL